MRFIGYAGGGLLGLVCAVAFAIFIVVAVPIYAGIIIFARRFPV
jgi:hypothetical protein